MIDPLRHITVFDPVKWEGRIDVIGCGATGSRVVLELAKLGIGHINVWDGDLVEEHNIANQVFGISDIGKGKAACVADIANGLTRSEAVIPHQQFCDGSEKFGRVVYLLTDTMKSRKTIFEKAIKMKMHVRYLIETRMGIDEGRLYAFNPLNKTEVSKWEETLYDDDVTEVSACGAQTTVGPTAAVLAGMAVWAMISHEQKRKVPHETLFYLRPPLFVTRSFD